MGRDVSAGDYQRAQGDRAILRGEVDGVLEGVDALILPTLPIPAPALGVDSVELGGSTLAIRQVMLRLTQLANLTGHPAVSLPCGTTSQGLPCGAQLVGRRRGTLALLHVASWCEPIISPSCDREEIVPATEPAPTRSSGAT